MTGGRVVEFAALVRPAKGEGAGRHVVAVAGPPGPGGSPAAERLTIALNAADPGCAAVLPMDGSRVGGRVLVARGLRARKGAPDWSWLLAPDRFTPLI